MKIRKLQIRNYKIFDNIDFDFTDKEGKAIDKIVLAGINGTGKTTLLKLLMKIFSDDHRTYRYSRRRRGSAYLDTDEIINCDNISIELEFTHYELNKILSKLQSDYNQLQKRKAQIDKYEFDTISKLINKLKQGNIVQLNYTLQKENEEIKLIDNEFILFNIFRDEFKKEIDLKVCYFPAETKIYDEDYRRNEDFKDIEESIEKDDLGILRIIDLGEHKDYVEKYILHSINEKIYSNREIPAGEIIKQETAKINNILAETQLETKLVDVNTNSPVFESFNGAKISMSNLSAGEKQIFYRAVYLNSLELKDSIIMSDEPELSLHPTWQSSVSNLYSKTGSNNQIILATHSPHIISSTNPENLFSLYVNNDKMKIDVVNIAKVGKHTRGVEPNRILRDIMQTPLRDYKIQEKIDYVSRNLKKEFGNAKMTEAINELIQTLGNEDPFVIRLNNQLILLNRKKS